MARSNFKLVFPGARGGYLKIRNWRRDHWNPALIAAALVDSEGKADRPPMALRHTFATNALRANLPTFTVARRMGTSVQMVERTYGHQAEDAMEWELEALTGRHMDAASEAE
jgi:integrase